MLLLDTGLVVATTIILYFPESFSDTAVDVIIQECRQTSGRVRVRTDIGQ